MGEAVSALAQAVPDIGITGLDRGDSIEPSISECDAVLDFSHAEAVEQICRACISHQKPLVIGTTGHSAKQTGFVTVAAKAIPVLQAANFSVGVNTLFSLARKAAELLGAGFDLEIVETHHRLKKDAPSGTAKRLAQILCEARGLTYEENVVHGREGSAGERPENEIGIHAIRAGDVVGDHTVIFASSGERLELAHKASSRETFAAGALRAARWIIGKPPGLYSMEDVLGL